MKFILSIVLTLCSTLHAQSITAHRGASHEAPQNTIAAFELAFEKGADFIEGDFLLTKDNRVVCIHDKDSGKLADKKLVIEQSTWAELQSLDVGYKKGEKWKGTRIPLLEDVLKTIPTGKGIFIEIKSGPKIVSYIKPILAKSEIKTEQIHFICFKNDVLKKCKELMPKIKTQLLLNLKDKHTVKWLIEEAKKLNLDGVGTKFKKSIITAENVKTLQEAGIYWNVWTINKTSDANILKSLKVDFITTDRPLYIRESLK